MQDAFFTRTFKQTVTDSLSHHIRRTPEGFDWGSCSMTPFFNTRSEQLALSALRNAVPAVYQYREFVLAGGLMSYGGSLADQYRQIAAYVGTFQPSVASSQARRLKCCCRCRIAAASPVDEVDVVALGDRGREAGHQRRVLAVKPVADRSGGLRYQETVFEHIGKVGPAIENHAQPVVELAEIGIFDHLLQIGRGHEATHPNLVSQDQVIEERPHGDSTASQEQRNSHAARGARFELDAGRGPRHRKACLRDGLGHARTIFDERDDFFDRGPEGCGTRSLGRHDQKRKDHPASRRNGRESAREAREIGTGTRWRGGDRKLAPFHGGIGPCQTAARKNRVGNV
jgi:hypothetical protein